MKLTKPLFIIIAGLLVSLTGQLQAQVIPGSVSISGGPPVSPQLAGTTNWIQYSAAIGGASDDDCETLHPSNTIVAWSSSYGTWVTSSNNPAYWTNVFSAAGWYTNVITCTVTFWGTDCDGTNYSTNTIASVTNVVAVYAKSGLIVFVCQPWPNYPNDGFDVNNPAPLGYPLWAPGVNAGHVWWELATATPTNVLSFFCNPNAASWVNTQVGYGPQTSLSWYSSIMQFITSIPPTWTYPTAPGELPFTSADVATVQRSYAIGFRTPGIINGLNATEQLHESPGTYDLRYFNCAISTTTIGNTVGLSLPGDWIPEDYGFDLPPSSP